MNRIPSPSGSSKGLDQGRLIIFCSFNLLLMTSSFASAATVPPSSASSSHPPIPLPPVHYPPSQPPPSSAAELPLAGLSPEDASWSRVQDLAYQVAESWYSPYRGRGIALASRPTTYRLHGEDYKANTTSIDLSKHNQIIRVDVEKRIIHAEPMVTMEQLVKVALAHGLVPKIVAPFRHVTVGGAIMGSAVSSASHLHGRFHDTCSYLTVVLGNGTIVTCSKVNHPELFHSLSGSYGTLGLVALAGIQCEPAASHVRLSYTLQPNIETGVDQLKQLCRYHASSSPPGPLPPVPDFLDAVALGESMTGPLQLTISAWHEYNRGDQSSTSPSSSTDPAIPSWSGRRARDLFYFEHLEDIGETLLEAPGAAAYTERMTMEDYLFRFDRGAFWLAHANAKNPLKERQREQKRRWELSAGWLYPLASKSFVARWGARWLFTSSMLFYLLRQATPDLLASRLIIMNPSLPVDRACDLVAFTKGTVPINTPLYLCPVRGAGVRQPFSPHGHINTLFLEVGIYGRVEDGRGREHSRRIEHFVSAQEGRKALCGQNFYEPNETGFWRGFPMYNLAEYQYLREKYAAEGAFPDLATKVCEPLEGNAGLVRRYLNSRRRKFIGLLL